MLKSERQDHIMEILETRKYCTVEYLAKTLYAAPITIRRDLTELEAAGRLTRCHGGAALLDHQNREVPFDLRNRTNTDVKDLLGKKAAGLLKDGNTVFMDASSTVFHITEYLEPEQNLTVITNSMKVMETLRQRHIRCYLTGGMLLENSFALIGNIAEKTISELYADVCFFSTQGITQDGIITDFSEAETRLRQYMIKHAKHRVYLFDSSKLGQSYLFKVCDAADVDTFITDAQVDFSKHP